jgi:hypothetical protein
MESQQDLIIDKRLLRPNFLYFRQLIENVTSTICDWTVAKPDMLDLCRQYFSMHKNHIISINKFAKKYQSWHAAHWYTKDSFIHRIVNKVLRTGNIEYCFLLRFYISDLSKQLYQLKCQQQKVAAKTEKNTILYRGLTLSEAHLKTLQNLVGQIILTKGFISTTRNKEIALWYAGASHPQSPESQSLLIEINVDMTAPDIIAADIAHLSNFPVEQEVLFDMSTRFLVESFEYDSLNGVWHCRFVAMSNGSQVIQLFQELSSDESCINLNSYSEVEAKLERRMRRERRQKFISTHNNQENDFLWFNLLPVPCMAISSSDPAHITQQKALIHWHQNADVHQLHSESKRAMELLKQENDGMVIENNDTACFLHNFGYICLQLEDTDYAIDLLKQASDMRIRLGTSERFCAQSLRNLGLAYIDKGDYENALASLNHALIIGQQGPPTAQCCTAMTLRNFGYFYYVRSDYSQAVEYLSKALETFQQSANLCIEGYKM